MHDPADIVLLEKRAHRRITAETLSNMRHPFDRLGWWRGIKAYNPIPVLN
jgi:hypothetical protein